MLEFERQYPDEIYYSTVSPPTLFEVSQLYPRKPILAVSMFALYGLPWEAETLSPISLLRQTTDCHHPESLKRLLRGRAHIEAIGIECGTDGIQWHSNCE